MLKINYDRLEQVIEFYAKPMWDGADPKWPWRQGGGESYIQDKVLPKAQPYLTREAIQQDTKDSLLNALKVHINLLSQFEYMYAKTFIDHKPVPEIRDHVLALLYGPEELGLRLKNFLEWAKVQPLPEKNGKQGITPTVATYLLAVSNPQQYPFCKPSAYDSAVSELLGKTEIRRDPVERILHCQMFYTGILRFLEKEYGLLDGNLIDVHSMLFCFQAPHQDGRSAWENSKIESPSGKTNGLSLPPSNFLFDLLMARHNLVLYGPPGTGKTREALRLGRSWKETYGPETVSQITFHPSYSYEDFIEGFRPTPDGSGFALKDGIFKILCKKAAANPEGKFLLIIDEINRGDVARILGELITLLEGDKRGQQYQTILLSDQPFFVPENLYVLGTMNTADKSISLMDLAIRRRFLFHYFPPNPDVLDEGRDFLAEVGDLRLSRLLIGLNQRLMDIGIDRDRVLGHSFFLIPRDADNPVVTLKNRFLYEVIPLVEEYCYSHHNDMNRVLGDLVELNGAVNLDVFEDDARFLAALQTLSDIG